MFASIDPGKKHCGVALWDKGELQTAYLVQGGEEWLSLLDGLSTHRGRVKTGVMEIPQVYPGSPVRPEDLIQLAASAGAIAGYLGGVWRQARPPVWTRQTTTNKDIRLQRAWDRLTPTEQSRVLLPATKLRKADVLDAIALGLWALDRW